MKPNIINLKILVGILLLGCSSHDTDTILKKAKETIADEKTISKMYTSAECSGPNGTFQTQIWSSREGYIRFEQRSSRDTMIAGINDSRAWSLSGDKVSNIDLSNEAFLHGHELHLIAADPRYRFTNPSIAGKSIFNEKQALKVTFQDKLNNPVDIYYDSAEFYPLGMEILNPFDSKAGKIQILFQNWKQLENGFFFFTKASFIQGGQVWQYDYTTIDPNNFENTVFHPRELVKQNRS